VYLLKIPPTHGFLEDLVANEREEIPSNHYLKVVKQKRHPNPGLLGK